LEQNQPILIYQKPLVEEIVFWSVPDSYFQGQREVHSRRPFLCLLRINT